MRRDEGEGKFKFGIAPVARRIISIRVVQLRVQVDVEGGAAGALEANLYLAEWLSLVFELDVRP